jgi:pyruvate dehydrogenase E2 component (dihydrolipoamide acetyltransferase)
MAQVLEFRLPDLGEGLTEAEIVRWLVEVGDVVTVDQPVVEVETAKAMVEVPCPYGGVVTARFGEEGTELPVGAPLLTVAVGETASGDTPGEGDRDGARTGSGGTGSGGTGSGGTGNGGGRTEGSGNVLVGYGTGAPPARRRRVRPNPPVPGAANGTPDARTAPGETPGRNGSAGRTAPAVEHAAANGASVSPAAGTGTGQALATGTAETGATGAGTRAASPRTPTTGAVPAHRPSRTRAHAGPSPAVGASRPDDGRDGDGPVAVISPLVRRLAREHGVDLRQLSGSGPDGLILRADVEDVLRANAARNRTAAPSAAGTAATGAARPEGAAAPEAGHHVAASATRIPLRGVRGAVADKLSRSRREIPDATCWVDADATELMRARQAMNAAGGPKISLLALLARICTAALARFPELNATVDVEAREIVRLPEVHLGFAAQTERGLVVPVVKDAHTRDAESLTAEFARLTEAARAGTLSPADLTGGTFTLNNYGVFGVDGSTPILNHPEAAMLGVGRITPKPWVHQGELAVRQVVQLSLTFDHRVCDGGTAGGFLRYVADCVEQPAVLLRTL